MRLATLYTLFALLATAANIAAQDLWLRAWGGPFPIALSILAGTAIGLIVKYALDKRYIFRYKPQSASDDGKTFALYTLMGLATTVIFWGFEFGFHWAFGTNELRYLGGALGLAIGYLTKYQLDKRYVFRARASAGHI